MTVTASSVEVTVGQQSRTGFGQSKQRLRESGYPKRNGGDMFLLFSRATAHLTGLFR